MAVDVRVGCSGWDYPDWRGVVYPSDLPRKEWFGHYADRFDTVEINNTFYRLPDLAKVRGWRERAPGGFLYTAKLGQFGTHRKKLKDAREWLPNFTGVIEELGPTLGPILVQLPPRWNRNHERLGEFLEAAPARFRWAVEVRDRSWLHDEVLDLLSSHGVALCIHDLLDDHPREVTADWVYVRYHGPRATDEPYRGSYDDARLEKDAAWLAGLAADGHDVFAYFNNDYDGHAPEDAVRLRELIAEERRAR